MFREYFFFSDNEREKCIMELYRALMQQSAKVKRIELWNRVQSSEHPISQKYFDSVLRKFCYSQGQSWLLKPK